jgi:hypothetical protein
VKDDVIKMLDDFMEEIDKGEITNDFEIIFPTFNFSDSREMLEVQDYINSTINNSDNVKKKFKTYND